MNRFLTAVIAAGMTAGVAGSLTDYAVRNVPSLQTFRTVDVNLSYDPSRGKVSVRGSLISNWSCSLTDRRQPVVRVTRVDDRGRRNHEFYDPVFDGGVDGSAAGEVRELNFDFVVPAEVPEIEDPEVYREFLDSQSDRVSYDAMNGVVRVDLVVPCGRPVFGVVDDVVPVYGEGLKTAEN